MRCIEVDAANGVDTNAGSDGSPVLTIARANALASPASGVEGDHVLLWPGVYREKITIQAGKAIVYEGRGEVFIDCESLREAISCASTTSGQDRAYFRNVKFLNCSAYFIQSVSKSTGTYNGNLFFHNCEFWGDAITPTIKLAKVQSTSNFALTFDECTFKRIVDVWDPGTGVAASSGCALTMRGCIVDTSHGIATGVAGTAAITNVTTSYEKNAYPGGTGSGNVDVTALPPPYNSATFPNPDLSLDPGGTNFASYSRTGHNGGNIGAAGFALIGAPNGLFDIDRWYDAQSGQRFISNAVYAASASDHGPLVFVSDSYGDGFEINTQAKPAATSGGLLSPVYKVRVQAGVTTSLRRLFRAGREDATLGAGSNKVIDSTPGDATRKAQYRAQLTSAGALGQESTSLAWTDQAMDADFTVSKTTDFYVQSNNILTLAGA